MCVRNLMMAAVTMVLVWASAVAADGAEDPKQPTDVEINRLLIGKWEGTDLMTGVTGTIRYAKDGTFTADASVPLRNRTIEINTEGTWSVTSGTILHSVTKSSRPVVAPVGTEVKETVHAIDDKSVRFIRGVETEKKTRTRIKE